LNAAQKRAARHAFALFLENPGHNSLQFKKLRDYPDYWSVRVSRDIRVVLIPNPFSLTIKTDLRILKAFPAVGIQALISACRKN
jgi:hypothetical protein